MNPISVVESVDDHHLHNNHYQFETAATTITTTPIPTTIEETSSSTMMKSITTTTISPLISLIVNKTTNTINNTNGSLLKLTTTTMLNDHQTTSTTTTTTPIPTTTMASTTSVLPEIISKNLSDFSSSMVSNLTNFINNSNNSNYERYDYYPKINSSMPSLMSSPSSSSSSSSSSVTYNEENNVFIESWNRNEFQIPHLYSLPTPIIILLIIGFIFFLWALIKFIQALWTFFFCYLLGYGAKWSPGPDSWAIVTGATDGIGLAYAKAMAKKGYCLLLLSRNQQKLEKVKTEILNEFSNCPQVKIMAVDFTLDTIYKKIGDEIRTLPGYIHVLINNVGMAYKYPEYFTKILNSDKFISDILNCNILSVTRMTHIVLPLMEIRRSGIIINISSYSALFPTPLLAMYSASKIYMDYFSRALNSEYKDKGIIVQSVLPYYVSTNMIRNPGISLMIPSPDQFVNSALKTVGVEVRTYGYFAHNILAFFQSFFVKFIIGNSLNTRIAFFRMKRFRKGCYKRKGLQHKF